jgi:outer membrane protein OmpA-like peptidoglycan-associated protein
VYPRENNLKYSVERAEVVAAYLRSKGVPPERIEVDGRAETQPVGSNISESGRRKNRRVEVRLVSLAGRSAPAATAPPAGSADRSADSRAR